MARQQIIFQDQENGRTGRAGGDAAKVIHRGFQMIELRWTWKREADGILASNVEAGKRYTQYPVLQYREALPDPIIGHTGGTWKDVPLPPKPED